MTHGFIVRRRPRGFGVDYWLPVLGTIGGSVLCGLVAVSARGSVVAVCGFALVAGAALVRSGVSNWVLPELVVALAVGAGALLDLPNSLVVGGISAEAALTTCVAVLATAAALTTSRHQTTGAPWPLAVLAGFCAWACTSLVWGKASTVAAQNVLVYVAFVATAYLGFALTRARSDSPAFLGRCFVAAGAVAFSIYTLSIVRAGIGGHGIVSNRGFALVGLIILAWFAAGWRYRVRWSILWVVSGVALIALSLSRTATVTAVAVVGLSQIRLARRGGLLGAILAVALVTAIVLIAITNIKPIHDRFFSGDVKNVGGISINMEGRSKFWGTTWRSYLTAPIQGHGVGSADSLIKSVYGDAAGHPHNDYLRILNDLGAVGALLWLVGYLGLIAATGLSWQRGSGPPKSRQVHAAACLSLIAVAAGMATDNVMIYLYAMAPLGVIVGVSCGLMVARDA